jgi:hypothetical protein
MDPELVRRIGAFGVLLTAVGLVAFASQRRRRAGAIGLGLAMQGGLVLAAAGALRLAGSAEWLLLVVVATGVITALGASAGVDAGELAGETERSEQPRRRAATIVEVEAVVDSDVASRADAVTAAESREAADG